MANTLPELEHGNYCYYMPETPNGKDGHYVVGIAVAGEAGYYLTDWDYGTDGKLAKETVAKMNREKLRLTDEQVDRIILSSMFKP